MEQFIICAAWVICAYGTTELVFPGLIADWPGGWEGAIMGGFMALAILFTWPLYAAVAPLTYGFLWLIGDWKPSEHFSKGRKP